MIELTQHEKITIIVMLDEKIKEWTQLNYNFPGMEDVFNVQELITIKKKLQDGND